MPIANSSPALYQLGKGIISIGEWVGLVPPPVLADVGNAPEFEVEVTEEKIEHKSSRTGVGAVDKEVIIETGYTVNFILDEVSVSNLARFVKGTVVGSNVINANTALGKEFAMEFVSDNPAGEQSTWRFHKMTLSPNGAFALIGEDFSQLGFTGTGLSDDANNPSSPFFKITVATTTTTTTTTTT